MDTFSDAQLLLSAQSGDGICLALLMERHRARLYAAALRILGHGADAEDAVHDTFFAALTHIHEVRDPEAVAGWLHAVLRRACLQQLRQRKAEVLTAEPPDSVDERGSVEERVERSMLRDWVFRALQNLPEPLRVTVMLRYFGSYDSYEELAAILGIPIGTVRSRISEAKAKLADALLETAGLADDGTRALARERERFYMEAFRDLFRRGTSDRFLEHYAPDLELRFSSGREAHGREHLAAEVDSDLEANVLLHPQRVLSSDKISIVEARFENPPEDPEHCPAGLAMVVFLDHGKARRVHLHLAARPPRPEES